MRQQSLPAKRRGRTGPVCRAGRALLHFCAGPLHIHAHVGCLAQACFAPMCAYPHDRPASGLPLVGSCWATQALHCQGVPGADLRLCEGGARDEEAAELAPAEEQCVLDDRARHEVGRVRELLVAGAVPHRVDVWRCGLQLVRHLRPRGISVRGRHAPASRVAAGRRGLQLVRHLRPRAAWAGAAGVHGPALVQPHADAGQASALQQPLAGTQLTSRLLCRAPWSGQLQ